jgi:hypothetical protein
MSETQNKLGELYLNKNASQGRKFENFIKPRRKFNEKFAFGLGRGKIDFFAPETETGKGHSGVNERHRCRGQISR